MTRAVGNRFRTRKLSTKQSLAVLREHQIDSVDDDGQRNIPQIETGVERQEEIEHHLQAAISASQAAAVGAKVTQKIFIPTPNTTQLSSERYGSLYPKHFAQPASYIRFSSTVEDSCGTSYCMSPADDGYLSKLNSTRRNGLPPITEDEFETVMEHYEKTIQNRQPFLSMDVSNVMPYEELESAFEADFDANVVSTAKLIYAHWREQKISRLGRPIIPTLKVITFEQGNEKDDGDPYVCFRRREVRQQRKTRRTDAQSTDKLKRIRQELETARGLIKDVFQRETVRKNAFIYDQQIFENRQALLSLKRKLGLPGDEEDYYNPPPRKRIKQGDRDVGKPKQFPPGGKPPDAELRHLPIIKAEEEKARVEKYNHLRSLRPAQPGVVELTEEKLLSTLNPTLQPGTTGNFCSVRTYYLPSPPPSAGSESSSLEKVPNVTDNAISVSIVQAPPANESPSKSAVFRRRVGRGGRVLIDRRSPKNLNLNDINPSVVDRVKYDNDSEDLQRPVFPLELHSTAQLRFRARMLSPPPESNVAQPQVPRRPFTGSPIVGQHASPQVGTVTNTKLAHHPQQQAVNGQSFPHTQLSPHFPQHAQALLGSNHLTQHSSNGFHSPVPATQQR